MVVRRILIGLWLVVASVTHLAAGMASGAADPTSTVVICRGHAAVTIHLDANGQEVEGWTLCPEVIGTLLAAVDAGQATSAGADTPQTSLHLSRSVAQTDGLRGHHQRSRGPPVAV